MFQDISKMFAKMHPSFVLANFLWSLRDKFDRIFDQVFQAVFDRFFCQLPPWSPPQEDVEESSEEREADRDDGVAFLVGANFSPGDAAAAAWSM